MRTVGTLCNTVKHGAARIAHGRQHDNKVRNNVGGGGGGTQEDTNTLNDAECLLAPREYS